MAAYSQVERLNVLMYVLEDDQHHPPGVTAAQHLWRSANIAEVSLENFLKFQTRLTNFFNTRGIANYILNLGPMYLEHGYIILEKYNELVPDTFVNTLYSLNYSDAEAQPYGGSQVGFVLWRNPVHPPAETVTYNPEYHNAQDGVEVAADLTLNATGLAPVVQGETAWGNLAGGGRRSFRRRRTFKKRRSLRKRASRRSS